MKTKLFLLFAVLNISIASAQTFTVDGVNYVVVTGTTNVEVYSNPGYTGVLTLPETVDYLSTTYLVTTIRDNAFLNCTGLTSVTISNSVISIGVSAFQGCTGLKSLVLGTSVTSIGNATFLYCSGLTSVTLPASLNSIGQRAFEGCAGLTSITIPDSVTSLATNAFASCIGVTSLNIGSSLTYIASGAFSGCSSLTSVTIPNLVHSIGIASFKNCTSLTSLSLGNSMNDIQNSAFEGCTNLTTINCDVVTPPVINANVFENVNQANCALNVPDDSVSAYQAAAIWKDFNPINNIPSIYQVFTVNGVNYKITSTTTAEVYLNPGYTGVLILPETVDYLSTTYTVTSIRDNAFDSCTGLTSVTIPNSVTSTGGYSFFNCTSLTFVALPTSLNSIGQRAFEGCTGLSSIVIPDSVTSLATNAFSNCTGLTSLNIGSSLTYIANGAFGGCKNLTTVTIPDTVNSIGISSFSNCIGLISVNIGSSVSKINWYAFSNCTSLTTVNCNVVTPPVLKGNVFENVNQTKCALNVPDESLSLYQVATIWKDFNTINDIPSIYKVFVVDGVNYKVTSTTTVEVYLNPDYTGDLILPETVDYLSNTYTVTFIREKAFEGCKGLISVVFPNSVTAIGNAAFYNCSGLTSVILPNSLNSIGQRAFEGCIGLTSITIPDSVTSISTNAFAFCSGISSLSIGNSVNYIASGAFSGCSSLTSVTIPNPVHSIGGATFSNCTSLTTVNIANSVNDIQNYAFSNCTSLTTVNCNVVTPPVLKGNVFENVNQANCLLNVPESSVSAYQAAAVWKNFNPIAVLTTDDFINEIDILFYPNPVQNNLFLELNNFNNALLEVIDLNGKIVINKTLSNAVNTIDTSYLTQGMYFFKVTSDNGTIIKKVIKH